MTTNRLTTFLVASTVVAAAAACSPRVHRLVVSPAEIVLHQEEADLIDVEAYDAEGRLLEDVAIELTAEDESMLALYHDEWVVFGNKAGETTLTARAPGASATVKVTVLPARAEDDEGARDPTDMHFDEPVVDEPLLDGEPLLDDRDPQYDDLDEMEEGEEPFIVH